MNSDTSTATGSLTTVLQYATIAAVGYGIYYSRQKANVRQTPQPSRAVADTEPRSEKTAKKQRVQQYAQEASSQKQTSKAQPKTSQSLKQDVAVDDDADDELNNKEFAKQLASLKEGKKFAATSNNDKKKKKQKSVKQSQAQVHEPVATKVSPPSSTGGIDADDDQSPPTSPQVAAADAGGIDDMLEAPAPGPASMRIVSSETSQPQKAKAQKQAAEAPLSKKQKQRRRKAEANKAAAEEAEKDRKDLMEKQRRLARVSEGRAAKDGSQFMASVNGKNAWQAGQPNGVAAAKPSAEASPAPLDTFEKSAPAPAPKKAPAPSKGDTWMSSVPSEEEQMELLKSETEADEWSTVTTKKPKKTSTPTEEKTEPAVAAPKKAPQAFQSAQPKAKAPSAANGKPAVASGYGSFSALTTEETEEEEEELEWDV